MKIIQNRTSDFPRKAEANFGGGKICKRPAYSAAYFLLTFAYMPAYPAAYLPSPGKAGSDSHSPIRLVLWVENFARYSASCWFLQNRLEVI
jgi:hypothetical protein